jgi:5S rRNA maturation endonuclease (ribonuclease M5)
MTYSLVIVESPAKCKKIESYLGPGYKVIASFGHLRTISGLESIDIQNGFNTKYSVIQEPLKLKQIEKIRAEILKSDDVIIATDDDREGEAIGWHICDLFGLYITNTKRIIFHEITESAIQSAISHPKRINMNLVEVQLNRSYSPPNNVKEIRSGYKSRGKEKDLYYLTTVKSNFNFFQNLIHLDVIQFLLINHFKFQEFIKRIMHCFSKRKNSFSAGWYFQNKCKLVL